MGGKSKKIIKILYRNAKNAYYKNIKMLNKSEPQTLEEQKTGLEFSMKESDYQTALRKEMEKIRKEGKITGRYEIIREAEMRIKK